MDKSEQTDQAKLIVAEGKLRILREALKDVRDMTGDPAIIDTVELALKLTEEE